ncbi:MAG: hypothetical protein JNJ85_13860 [Candidatus Kapabacteria bacterium]|nr:hypothetical protein [Candidatus Kapabacteria bacterium]
MQNLTMLHLLAFVTISTFAHAQDSTLSTKKRNVEMGIRISNFSGYGIFVAKEFTDVSVRLTAGAWKPWQYRYLWESESNTVQYNMGLDVRSHVYQTHKFEYNIGMGTMYETKQTEIGCGLCRNDSNNQSLNNVTTNTNTVTLGVCNGVAFKLNRFKIGVELAYILTLDNYSKLEKYINPSETRKIEHSGFVYNAHGFGYGLSIGYVF